MPPTSSAFRKHFLFPFFQCTDQTCIHEKCTQTDSCDHEICERERNSSQALLEFECSLPIDAFNIRTFTQIGQHATLARTRGTVMIYVWCVSDRCMQILNSVITHHSPDPTSFSGFNLRLSDDRTSSACGQTGVGTAMSMWATTVLWEWIPVNNCLCAVRFVGSINVGISWLNRHYLFVVSAYAVDDCKSPEAI